MWSETAVIVRTLLQQRSFTLATVSTLALGIAAPTALFSAVNAVLLRPLPFPRAEDIFTIRTTITDGRFTSGLVATAELTQLRQSSDAVLHVTGALPLDYTLLTDSGPLKATGYGVLQHFFDLFGVPMALGRGFTSDEHKPGGPTFIVLSHRIWRTVFGADPEIIGKAVGLPNEPNGTFTVVGVAGPSFEVPQRADFWVNLKMSPDNIGHSFEGYLRLRPGTTVEALREPMHRVMQDLAQKHPDQNKNRVFVLRPLLHAVVGDLGPMLVIVFAATALLLALACVNVTNLMLARATVRAREMAVRTALGASRWRVVRQSLIESVLLAAAGGVLGLLGAYAGLRTLLALGGAELPRLETVTFDPTVLLFAGAVIAMTGVVVGLAPAMRLADTDISTLMNEGGRSATGSRRTRRLLAALVAVEVAVGMALLASTGRLVRSFANLQETERGFTSEDLLIVDVLLPFDSYREPERHVAWFDEVAERIRALGATGVAAASSLPLRSEWDTTTFVDIASQPTTDPHTRPNARLRQVSPGFFELMGVRIAAGRAFRLSDTTDAAAVALVNEAFVRRFLADRDPLRERITLPGFRARMVNGRPHSEQITIVGVAADVKYAGLHLPPEQTVYLVQAQRPFWRQSLVISAPDGRPERLTAQVRAALEAVDPVVAAEFGTMSQVVASSLSRPRIGMILMSLFGLAALVLITVGVLGVVGYVVAQRTGEIAVRLALGATRASVFWLVFTQSGRLAALGILMGLVLTWWSGQLIAAYVYRVSAADPEILAFSALSVLIPAFGAALLPARRAAAVDPARVLRSS